MKKITLKKGLSVSEIGDELLVFDQETHQAHHLSAETAKVFKALESNQQNELTTVVDEEVLATLDEKSLLVHSSTHPRRDFLKRSALVAASVPLVTSISAMPASAASSGCSNMSGSAGCTHCGAGASNFIPLSATSPIPAYFNCCPCDTNSNSCDCTNAQERCVVRMRIPIQGHSLSGNFLGWEILGNGEQDQHQFWECTTPNDGGGSGSACQTCQSDCKNARDSVIAGYPGYNPTPHPTLPGVMIHYPASSGATEDNPPALQYGCCSVKTSDRV